MSAIPVSNSEYVDWNTCKRRHYNAYNRKIEPVRKGKALSYGLIGHACLQVYYDVRKQGGSHEEGISKAYSLLTMMLESHKEEYGLDRLLFMRRLLQQYFDHYGPDENWVILEVEKYYRLPMNDQFYMPMRLDLLVQEVESGKVFIVDTKHTYDFWPEPKKRMSPQFPKYFATVRYNKIHVDGIILNEIRYRSNAVEKFKRSPIFPSDHKIRVNLDAHVIASTQIATFNQLPQAQQERLAIRLLNDKVCQYCPFLSLCDQELDGGNTDLHIEMNYKQKSYGYSDADFKEEAAE